MLHLVGLGLADEKDITVRGLEIVKKAERVYLEAYTAILLVDKAKLVSLPSSLPSHIVFGFFCRNCDTLKKSLRKSLISLCSVGSLLRPSGDRGGPRISRKRQR